MQNEADVKFQMDIDSHFPACSKLRLVPVFSILVPDPFILLPHSGRGPCQLLLLIPETSIIIRELSFNTGRLFVGGPEFFGVVKGGTSFFKTEIFFVHAKGGTRKNWRSAITDRRPPPGKK